jgi:hypothetical protein
METTTQHGYLILRPAQQVGHLGDVRRDAPGLIVSEQIRRASQISGKSIALFLTSMGLFGYNCAERKGI